MWVQTHLDYRTAVTEVGLKRGDGIAVLIETRLPPGEIALATAANDVVEHRYVIAERRLTLELMRAAHLIAREPGGARHAIDWKVVRGYEKRNGNR